MTRSPEDRLRQALQSRADQIEPSPDGLDRIEEKLMDVRSLSRRQTWTLGVLGAAAAVLVVVVGLVVLADDDGDADLATGTSTTTSSEPTSTTEATTTTTFSPTVDPYAVAFPSPTDSRRFDDPTSAARAYATDVLGFTDLEVGDYRSGDSRSGEVPVTDRPGRAETTILVRQMDDDAWFVLGSQTADIEVDEPTAGATVTPLFRTSGRALAFEGTVDVVVLPQGDPTPLGEGFVTGSGTPPAGPFGGRIRFEAPSDDRAGVLVYRTMSAEDGHVEQATSFPVRLSAGTCEDPGADLRGDDVFEVWQTCGADGISLAVAHRSAGTDGRPTPITVLEALVDGPTEAELNAGFASVFPAGDAGARSLSIDEGVATVDLDGAMRDELQSTSATTGALRDQVFFTLEQFQQVLGFQAIEIHFDGSCEAFAAWSESDSCRITG